MCVSVCIFVLCWARLCHISLSGRESPLIGASFIYIYTQFRDFRLRASVGEDLLRSWIQAFDSVGLTVMDPNGLHEHRNPGRPVAREPCPGFAADSGVVLNVQRKQDPQAVLKDSSAADSSPPSALLSPPAPPPPPKPLAANATDLLAQRALATKESPAPARPPPPAGAPPPPKQFKEQLKQQREQQQLQQIEILKAELERMKLEQVMCDKDPGPEEVHNQLQQCATEDSTVSAASTATNRAQELHSPSSCSMDEDNKLSIPMSLHSPTLSPSNATPPPPLAPGPQPQATAVKLKTKKPMNMQDELLAKLNKIKQKNGVHQGPELC